MSRGTGVSDPSVGEDPSAWLRTGADTSPAALGRTKKEPALAG